MSFTARKRSHVNDRFERNLLYHCIILFHVGVLIKIFFTLKFDPWALFIPWFHGNAQNCLYKHKKKSISLIWCIITCILIGDFFYFIPQSILVLCTVIFTVGPLLFLILMSAWISKTIKVLLFCSFKILLILFSDT